MERAAEFKSEYLSGEIFATAGTSARHSLICSNINVTVAVQTKPRGCRTYTSDLRVHVRSTYAYPDVSVVCGKVDLADDYYLDNLLNPTIIFEVLSKSTEGYDRGEKFARYAEISSLNYYILVSQDKPNVEVFERLPDDTWHLIRLTQLEAEYTLSALDCKLKLAEIYDQVDFAVPADIRIVEDN